MRIVEILVAINAIGGIATVVARWLQKRRGQRRSKSIEHTAELEKENVELDAALRRMRGEK